MGCAVSSCGATPARLARLYSSRCAHLTPNKPPAAGRVASSTILQQCNFTICVHLTGALVLCPPSGPPTTGEPLPRGAALDAGGAAGHGRHWHLLCIVTHPTLVGVSMGKGCQIITRFQIVSASAQEPRIAVFAAYSHIATHWHDSHGRGRSCHLILLVTAHHFHRGRGCRPSCCLDLGVPMRSQRWLRNNHDLPILCM